jgi:hypothetical protein
LAGFVDVGFLEAGFAEAGLAAAFVEVGLVDAGLVFSFVVLLERAFDFDDLEAVADFAVLVAAALAFSTFLASPEVTFYSKGEYFRRIV